MCCCVASSRRHRRCAGQRRRMPPSWRTAIADGRLLVISPFTGVRRPTAKTARARNRLVVSAAQCILVVYAAPGGETERMALDALQAGKNVFALAIGEANTQLFDAGATPLSPPWQDVPRILAIGLS